MPRVKALIVSSVALASFSAFPVNTAAAPAVDQSGTAFILPAKASVILMASMEGPAANEFNWIAVVAHKYPNGTTTYCHIPAREQHVFSERVESSFSVHIFGADHGARVYNSPLGTGATPFDRTIKIKSALGGRDEHLRVDALFDLRPATQGAGAPAQADILKVTPQPDFSVVDPANVPPC